MAKKKLLSMFGAVLCMGIIPLLFSCNDKVEDDFEASPEEVYQDVSKLDENGTVDLSRIKAIKFYNWELESGWANVPVKFTVYTEYKTEYQTQDYAEDGDLLINEIPFADFSVDRWGYTLEWTSDDTGTYAGSAKTLTLSKTLNLEKYKTIVLFYTLEADEKEDNQYSRFDISFVDNKGNETEPDNFQIRKTN